MASADIDQRQLDVAFLVLLRHIRQEHELAFALDLYEFIQKAKVQRDSFFAKGYLRDAERCEMQRNEYIDQLSRLLEKNGFLNAIQEE